MLYSIVYLVLSCLLTVQAATQTPLLDKLTDKKTYRAGDAIPVTCLNRTTDGSHVSDPSGQLQYIPFPTCSETGRPLELYFGVEKQINCTIDFVEDVFFHTLEFYVHNDSPFTCRIPARPMADAALHRQDSTEGTQENDEQYITLVVALTGTLQLSHLHVSTHLNVLMHAVPKSTEPGVIAAGTAYSVATPMYPAVKIIPGESLPLVFTVRWYPNTLLPSGWTGVGGHIFASTLVYCLLCAGAATAICIAYFRGIDMPRRLRSHGKNRLGASGEAGRLPGYGYGLGPGKRD